MKSIVNSFVTVAPDCPVEHSVVPSVKEGTKPSIHSLQYELLTERPYELTLEDLIYEVHVRHKEIPPEELRESAAQIRDGLFQKSHPCMRASMLPKKFGWGVHYDDQGKIALYGMETEEYSRFAEQGDGQIKVEPAMRNKRG
ncbi:MAG: hypothetical protein K0R75_1342 [Paenibacillaceae bacterium]|nr:hypothetical protein [Paenibacillaceae bacterium]